MNTPARAYPGAWRRFEAHDLPESRALDLVEGPLRVYPALVRAGAAVEVRFEWSAEEAARNFRDGAVALARLMLYAQARDLEKRIGGNAQLLLSAVPYFTRDALVETLLDLAFRRACFGEAEPPRDAGGVRRGGRSRARAAAFEPRGDRRRPRPAGSRRRATCAACWMIRRARTLAEAGAGEPRASRAPARCGVPRSLCRPTGCGSFRAICEARSAAGSARWPAAPSRAPLLAELRDVDAALRAPSGAGRARSCAGRPSSMSCGSGSRSTGYRSTRRSSRPSARSPRRAWSSAPPRIEAWLAR